MPIDVVLRSVSCSIPSIPQEITRTTPSLASCSRRAAVQWTSPDCVVTHEKSIVLDDRRALISTFNLVLKYFTETRDYGLITGDPAQVGQVAAGFDADWQHVPFHMGPFTSFRGTRSAGSRKTRGRRAPPRPGVQP
jgi:hypothetical protein